MGLELSCSFLESLLDNNVFFLVFFELEAHLDNQFLRKSQCFWILLVVFMIFLLITRLKVCLNILVFLMDVFLLTELLMFISNNPRP